MKKLLGVLTLTFFVTLSAWETSTITFNKKPYKFNVSKIDGGLELFLQSAYIEEWKGTEFKNSVHAWVKEAFWGEQDSSFYNREKRVGPLTPLFFMKDIDGDRLLQDFEAFCQESYAVPEGEARSWADALEGYLEDALYRESDRIKKEHPEEEDARVVRGAFGFASWPTMPNLYIPYGDENSLHAGEYYVGDGVSQYTPHASVPPPLVPVASGDVRVVRYQDGEVFIEQYDTDAPYPHTRPCSESEYCATGSPPPTPPPRRSRQRRGRRRGVTLSPAERRRSSQQRPSTPFTTQGLQNTIP